MSVELEQNQVCEACGCAGEMGFIIKEGDDVADVTIFAETKAALEAELAKYIEMACLLYTSPSPRDRYGSRMPSSA